MVITVQRRLNALNEWRFVRGSNYNYGMLPPRYPVPAIPITTRIRGDVVFQSWQYAISSQGDRMNMGRCLSGDYYAMLQDWRLYPDDR